MKIQLSILFFFFLSALSAQQLPSTLTETATQLQAAITAFEKAKNSGEAYQQIKSANTIARLYNREGLSNKAIEYYRIALALENEVDQKINLLDQLARAFQEEKIQDSVVFYQNLLLDLYREKGDYRAELKTLQQIAKAEEYQEKYKNALQTYQSILSLATTKKDKAEIAIAHNNIGYLQNHLGEFLKAIDGFLLAEKIDGDEKSIDRVTLYTNLAIAYLNNRQLNRALEYLDLARLLAKEDVAKTAQIDFLTAGIYLEREDLYNAQQYNNLAITNAQSDKNAKLLSQAYATAAIIHQELFEYEDALNYYQKHLTIKDSLLVAEKLNEQALLQMQFLLEKTEKEMRLLLVNESISELTIQQLELEKNNMALATEKISLEVAQKEASLSIMQKENAIREAEFKNKELAALQAQQQLRLTQQELEAQKKDRNIADLKQREELQKMQLSQQAALEKEQLQKIELLNQKQAISNLELAQQASFRKNAYIIGVLLLSILSLAFGSYLLARRANRKLAIQKAATEKEKEKSDALLLNILPAATAKELKEFGTATPQNYKQVTVLFTDFVNFTNFAENISAEALIEELNACFSAFDEIIERHGLEKIKTIGDAYMCAGGIPIANKTNALDAVKSGLAMQSFMVARAKERKALNLPYCNMRLGIHTGPVIAGVVGKKKFAYDIWGDTVNMASRMESAGEVGRVNVSETTYALVKNQFDCTYRGNVAAKNKGEVGMYFVVKGEQ